MSEGQPPELSAAAEVRAASPTEREPSAEDVKKQSQVWLALSAASFLVCFSGCFGLGGAVLCFLAGQDADKGQLEEARAKLKWARWLIIAGAVLGGISLMLMLFRWLG